jgi:phosphoglycerol transferase MdoB-like AlkP superfamily enzyme
VPLVVGASDKPLDSNGRRPLIATPPENKHRAPPLAFSQWLRATILAGVVYLIVGLTFAALAASAPSNQMRTAWRLSAWLISAVVFATDIWYEHFRLRSSSVTTAFHASLAVALGAFGIAVSAIIRAEVSASSHRGPGILAFLIWPVLIGVPAFVVALAAAALLSLRKGSVVPGL